MNKISNLKQTVAYKPEKDSMPSHLLGATSILGGKHGGKVKHGDVRVTVMVNSEVQVWHLVAGGEIGGFSGVVLQSLTVNVVWV
jgi:hypothetical protein